MNWRALFVVALAAPVWSHTHTHNHKRKHGHARRAFQEAHTAEAVAAYKAPAVVEVVETQVVETFVTVTIYETQAEETVQATAQPETIVTVTVSDTPAAEAVQTTQQPQTLVTVTVSETPAVEAVQTTPEAQTIATTATSETSAAEAAQTTQEVQTQTIATVATSETPAVEAVATTQETQATSTYAVETIQSTASAAATIKAPSRALWLWQSNIIQDSDEVAQFLSFAETNEIKSVYALVDRDMGDAVFQSFISQCNSSGIAVEALMGNSQWILGLGDPTLESQLTWLEEYQGNASANSQFAGIHLDVEPWGLDGWTSNEETYISALQSIVTQVTAVGTALGLPVAADLPYWADTITCPTTGKTLDSWMLDNLDSATFMTYRNTASELLDIATAVLEAGNTAGKPVWLAVETVDAADAILISYYGKTATTLFEDLVSVNASATGYASFAGIAIHDYDGVKALSS